MFKGSNSIESHSFLEYWQYRTDYCGPYRLLRTVPTIDSTVSTIDSTVPTNDSTVPTIDSTVPTIDSTVPTIIPFTGNQSQVVSELLTN